MRATTIYRGTAFKRVLVEDVPTDRGHLSDDLVIGFAMASVGESPARLFGWSVESRNPEGPQVESVLVTLNTD